MEDGTFMDTLERIQLPGTYTLIVAGAPEGVPVEWLDKLARSARHVIAVDRGAESLVAAGMTPDELVGDMDSLSIRTLEDLSARGVSLTKVPAEKDFTDLELAFDIVRREDGGPVVVCGATGGRIDHQLAVLGACARAADLGTMVVDKDSVIYPLAASVRDRVSLKDIGCRPGDTFSVLAMASGSAISESGGCYAADGLILDAFSGGGVSNVMADEDAVVSCQQGLVLVVIPFGI